MLVAVINATNYLEALEQINSAITYADAIELRLDFWKKLNIDDIKKIKTTYSIPMIFTLRKPTEGGYYQGDEKNRLALLKQLCTLNPEYMDIEYDVSKDFLKSLQQYPTIKFICSYHNFHNTPENLVGILESMQYPLFSHYKIATLAQSTIDALRMLQFVNTYSKECLLTGICMGETGQCTRIVGAIVGSQLNYATLTTATAVAPGQLSLDHLVNLYRVKQFSRDTKIYALLGDPIDKSVGHVLHNAAMAFLHKNAVYIKLKIKKQELPEAINLLRALAFSGFSVTMPLKEVILPFLDNIDISADKIGAINTVLIDQLWQGFNTDGRGAVHSILEKIHLKDKYIVVLGAGGAARAIVYELLQQGAKVTVVNRTLENAKRLAEKLGCDIASTMPTTYDVIINTLPEESFMELKFFSAKNLIAKTIAMDIVYQPIQTIFLAMAKNADCICIPGYEMFIRQAVAQLKLWFKLNDEQVSHITKNMRSYFL